MSWALLPLVLSLQAAPGGEALAEIARREWEAELDASPVWASLQGDARGADRWDDLSEAELGRRAERHRAVLAELEAIDRASLSEQERLTWEVVHGELAAWVEEFRLGGHLLQVGHQSGLPEGLRQWVGVHAASELGPNLEVTSEAAAEAWIRRLRAFPHYVEQQRELVRAGRRRGLEQPQLVLRRVLDMVEKEAAHRPEETGFARPLEDLPPRIPVARRLALRQACRAAVAEAVLPALGRFAAFLREEAIPAAPQTVGLGRTEAGRALYAFLVARHTTTSLTPTEVHALGLSEVARIRQEMEAVKARTGFTGTLAEFFTELRQEGRYAYHDPEALLSAYRNLAKRVDPLLVRLFGRLPRMPYGVEPMPADHAPHATTGFYYPAAPDGSRPGTYLVNLYRPETRPRWEMIPLTLHEAVPGHHLQGALAAELTDLPAFRRFTYYTAFGEGWALYAERLGHDIGLYQDPYDHFGQLAWEIWRAVRLVIDTGIHDQGWTREQAIRYFLDNSPRPELDVVNEVDRYIAMPGQALGYKIGELRIRQLRTRAEQQLGSDFDLRAFHDMVLSAGSLPLDLLEARGRAWIEAHRRNRAGE